MTENKLVIHQSSDWYRAELNGEVIMGSHRLSDVYSEVLCKLGVTIDFKEVSDEEMEEIS